MVSSIQPAAYAPLANAANSNRAPAQSSQAGAQRQAEAVRVDVADGGVRAARAALEAAIAKMDLALGAGREAANVMAQIRDLARGGGADAGLQALLSRYDQIIGDAIANGADMLAGAAMSVSVDPDAPPVTVQGYDLRLKDAPGAEDVLRISAGASLSDAGAGPGVARDADASLARLDAALSRLSAAAQKLTAHDGFLASLEGAVARGVDVDLDAEGARLLALQVSQGLAANGGAIAQARPAALLELFRE